MAEKPFESNFLLLTSYFLLPPSGTSMAAELIENENEFYTEYFVKVKATLKPSQKRGLALENQPQAHTYFHRPLHLVVKYSFQCWFCPRWFGRTCFTHLNLHLKILSLVGQNLPKFHP